VLRAQGIPLLGGAACPQVFITSLNTETSVPPSAHSRTRWRSLFSTSWAPTVAARHITRRRAAVPTPAGAGTGHRTHCARPLSRQGATTQSRAAASAVPLPRRTRCGHSRPPRRGAPIRRDPPRHGRIALSAVGRPHGRARRAPVPPARTHPACRTAAPGGRWERPTGTRESETGPARQPSSPPPPPSPTLPLLTCSHHTHHPNATPPSDLHLISEITWRHVRRLPRTHRQAHT
jgi:hypothetical protein